VEQTIFQLDRKLLNNEIISETKFILNIIKCYFRFTTVEKIILLEL